MTTDDGVKGRLWTRRETLGLLGMSGFGAPLALAIAPADSPVRAPIAAARCIVTPEQTDGPYFVDEALDRSDIRTDPSSGIARTGVPLRIAFNVSQIAADRGCAPIAGARVDVWHCDATGIYSDVRDFSFNTTGQKFLRGYQITNDQGIARFLTIYPGWYRGRTVHIHFKVRTDPAAGRGHEFSSQLYFDDALTDRVHRREPYAAKGQRTLRNDRDGIFRDGGSQLMLPLREDAEGYEGRFDVALYPDARHTRT